MLLNSNITEWYKTLRNPHTGSTITRAAIYRALDENGPEWIIQEIKSVIAKSRGEFPEYYHKRNSPIKQ